MAKYPVEVAIIEQRAGSLKVKRGKAARIENKKGFSYYKIKMPLQKSFKTKPIKFEYLYTKGKGYYTILYSPSPDQFIPMELDVVDGKLKAINEDLRMFLIDSIIDSQTRFKPITWLHKYGPLVAPIIVAIAIAIVIGASADMLQTAAGTVGSAANILNSVNAGQIIGG